MKKRDANNLTWRMSEAVAHNNLGKIVLLSEDDSEAAVNHFKQAAVHYATLLKVDPYNTDYLHASAVNSVDLGNIYLETAAFFDARQHFVDNLTASETVLERNANNYRWLHRAALSYSGLGRVELGLRNLDEAREWTRKALAAWRSIAAADAKSLLARHDVIVASCTLARIEVEAGGPAIAREVLRDAELLAEGLVLDAPVNATFLNDLVYVRHLIAQFDL